MENKSPGERASSRSRPALASRPAPAGAVETAPNSVAAPHPPHVAAGQPSARRLLDYVAPAARYRRQSLPPRENAYGPLREASALYQPPLGEALETALGALFESNQLSPREAAAAELAAWVEANAAALERLDVALECGRLRFPSEYFDHWVNQQGGDQQSADFEFLLNCPKLANLQAVHCRRAAQAGDYDAAVAEALRILKFGQLLYRGEGVLIDFLVASAVFACGAAEVRRLTRDPQLPHALAERLRRALQEPWLSGDEVAQALRVELCTYALGATEFMLRAGQETAQIVDYLLTSTMSRDDPRRPGFCALYLDVLRDHPAPFELADTVHQMSRLTLEGLAALAHPPEENQSATAQRLHEELAAWPILPSELEQAVIGEALGEGDAEALSPARFSSGQRIWAAESLRGVVNPLGKVYALTTASAADNAWHAQAMAHLQLAATRVAAGVRMYQAIEGTRPPTLATLVAQRYLATLPLDPFDGRPLRYCPTRGRLWSIGFDLQDQNGDPGTDTKFDYACGPDLVWQMP